MTMTVSRPALPLLVAFLMSSFAFSGGHAAQSQSNPFSALAGAWRGGGTLSPLGGDAERVLCRANYNVSGSKLVQQIDCAAAGYKFNVVTNLTYADGQLSGSWKLTNYDAGGSAAGSVNGNIVFVRISGDKFNGRMSITFSGSEQTVKILQFHAGSGKYRDVANLSLRR